MAGKFPPGSWTYDMRTGLIAHNEQDEIGFAPVATMHLPYESNPERRANAALIVEAPAMLEALRALVADNYGQPRGVTVPTLDPARAIIARIDGTDSDLVEAADGDTCEACGRASIDCSREPCPAVIADREG